MAWKPGDMGGVTGAEDTAAFRNWNEGGKALLDKENKGTVTGPNGRILTDEENAQLNSWINLSGLGSQGIKALSAPQNPYSAASESIYAKSAGGPLTGLQAAAPQANPAAMGLAAATTAGSQAMPQSSAPAARATAPAPEPEAPAGDVVSQGAQSGMQAPIAGRMQPKQAPALMGLKTAY